MDPAASYDSWYDSPRGRWIGETEYRLISRQLRPLPGEIVLDAGCGTGWFSRRFNLEGIHVVGLDKNLNWLHFADSHSPASLRWVGGDLRCLPFRDRTFDKVFSVAALCFVDDEREAVSEIVRVTRRRFAIGWLNRDSLLYRQKGAKGGIGSYRGARWRRPEDLPGLFDGLPVGTLELRSCVILPKGDVWARMTEKILPEHWLWGSLLVVSGKRL